MATKARKTAEEIQRGGRVSEGATKSPMDTVIIVLVLVFVVALLVARLY